MTEIPAWKRQLREATFRGVSFRVDQHTASFGRRIVDHEFPLRDEPYTEDLGRKQRVFSVTGYILGLDYMKDRDRLISACEQEGPGSLVHPFFGTKNVECVSLEVSERKDGGGYCEVSLTFHETARKALSMDTISIDRLRDAKASTIDAATSDLDKALKTIKQAEYIVTSATNWVKKEATRMSKVAAQIQAFQANPLGLTSLAYTVANLIDNAADLVLVPSLLGVAWVDALNAIRASIVEFEGFDDAEHRKKVARNLKKVFVPFFSSRSENPPPNITTVGRTTETRNTHALTRFLETIAVATWGEIAGELSYTSSADAAAERRAILDKIEPLTVPGSAEASILPVSDDSFQALQALTYAVEDAVPSEQNAPELREVTLSAQLPSLVLAYDLYDSLDLETEIIARNGVRHPGFFPAGQALEVLDV